ncbi:MAG: cytochrome c biogenesis protein CcsA [bacterium]|nr:MAG: cytochrome c biogenesis protein CcsA [bacterium]
MKKHAGTGLCLAAGAAMVAALTAALLVAPTERTMGDVQRIFYFHLGSAAAAFASFTFVLVVSLLFILTRSPRFDDLAVAAAEVGVLFCTFVLVTGPLWARPVWGKWWVWDPRLTTTLVLWFLYVGYLVLRSSVHGYRGAMAAAVFAVLAYVDVPIVYFSVRWWRGIHPIVLRRGGGMDPAMIPPLITSVAAFLLLAGVLIRERYHIERIQSRAQSLEAMLEEQLS